MVIYRGETGMEVHTQVELGVVGTHSLMQHNFFIKLKYSVQNWLWWCEKAMLPRRTHSHIACGTPVSLQISHISMFIYVCTC